MKIKKVFHYLFFFIFLVSFCAPVYAEDVVLKSARVVESYGNPTIENISINNNTITSGIKFNNLNEFIVLDLELENHSNNSIELESVDNFISSNYLNVETESIGTIINRDSSNNVRVKITYNNELLNQDEIYFRDSSIKFNFSVIPIENPNTSSILVMIIKLVLYINIGFSLFVLFKKKKKLAFLGLFFIPLIVYARDSKEVIINFDDIRAKGRFEEYSVIITNENGETEERTITYGEPIELPSSVTKTGYNFIGWVDQDGNSISNGDIITGEMSIIPSFEIITYTITYQLDGGILESDNPTTYTIEDQFTLNNPSKVGYTFAGWSSGSSTLQTNVTIYKGTTGNKTYTAFYSANQDTVYTVVHHKMDLNGEYPDTDIEIQTLHGATESNVTPQTIDYTGFITPTEQTKTILGDGSTRFDYYYEREQYTFRITDRTYITSSKEDGTYYYGTTINITAEERVGYSFKWNDNNTDYVREFTLTGNTILTPTYTAKNVRVTIYHHKMSISGSPNGSTVSQYNVAPTDSVYTAPLITFEGFTSPEPQTVTIAGDGTTVVHYYYTRNKYQLTLIDSEYITSNKASGEYYFETEITLTAKTREGYSFTKWSDDEVANPYTFQLKADKTIGPVYTRNQYLITLDPNGGSVDPNEILVDIGSSIGTIPTPTTTQNHTTFAGWYTLPDGGDEVTASTVPSGSITIYAHWEYHPEATLVEGSLFNIKTKTLAGLTNPESTDYDTNVEQIKVAQSLPNDFSPTTDNTVSINDSDVPIYIWYDSNSKILYYYTDAEILYTNANCYLLFYGFKKLSTIENINSWNTSKATDMNSMFSYVGYDCSSLSLDLSNWDVSNVTKMAQMFSQSGFNVSSWTIGNISNWNVGNVTTFSNMFKEAGKNASSWSLGDISGWNVSNVTIADYMFYYAGYKATTWTIGNLASWNTAKMKSLSYMFGYAGYSASSFELNLSNWNTISATTAHSMFYCTGYKATTWSIGNLSNWNVSNVNSISQMFYNAGYTTTNWSIGNLSSWNVSKVLNFTNFFAYAGYNSTTFNLGDLSGWNTSNVTSTQAMFLNAGYKATTWYVGNLSNWDVSKVTTMHQMFSGAGYSATSFVLDLSSWTTSKLNKASSLFYQSGRNATTWSVGNLSNWNMSNVDAMQNMFSYAGYKAENWSIGDISSWNTSSVTKMDNMFYYAGYSAQNWSIGNLSNWNVSNVETFYCMFSSSGYNSTTWSIGDLSSWDTRNAINMSSMFSSAGYNSTTWNSIGNLKIYAVTLSSMFSSCRKAKATVTIYNKPTTFNTTGLLMFQNSATESDALITVNYTSAVDNIDDIIATKSSNSNVVKGSLIPTS